MSRVLVLAVHPDDETLGCGGALLKHSASGDECHWLIATSMKRGERFSGREMLRRDKEIKKVAEMYSFRGVHKLDLPTMMTDTVPMAKIVSTVAAVMQKVRPEIMYIPFIGDTHSDHRVLAHAACSCAKTFRSPFLRRVLMMETLSETEFAPGLGGLAFIPNYFVDITPFLQRKSDIMRLYVSETAAHPFPRSEQNIKALASFRGATANCGYAEAFMLLKELA